MVSIAIPALAAMAASLPTGLGFGAGYGAGVRIGYDVLYPKLQPFAQELVSGIINAVRTVWSPGGPDSPAESDPGVGDVSQSPEFQARVAANRGVDIPSGRGGKSARVTSLADPCIAVRSRAKSLQILLQSLQTMISKNEGKPRMVRNLATWKRTRVKTVSELNALVNNPNNRMCVEGMKF